MNRGGESRGPRQIAASPEGSRRFSVAILKAAAAGFWAGTDPVPPAISAGPGIENRLPTSPSQTIELSPGIVRMSTLPCSLAAHLFANISDTKLLPPAPYVLLPKHQSMLDIILEGVLVYRKQRIFPHYLMKHTLPDWLGLYGGIHVVRQRDASQTSERRRNVAALRRAQQVLADGGVLVLHPEGTRSRGAVGRLQPAGLGMVVSWQKELGPIPLVPVGIRYGRMIHVRVGSPRVYTSMGETEMGELRGDLARLSGLPFRETPDAPEESRSPA